jgi:TfoX/Sxy family transcriptional regulator of competence genes
VCDVQQTEALVREKESKKAHFRSLTKALVAAHNNLTLAAQSVKNWSEQGWTWNERDETDTAKAFRALRNE